MIEAQVSQLQSGLNELKQLMKREEIGSWLLTEMEEFENRTPADLINKGETGRLWASLFYLRRECRIELYEASELSRSLRRPRITTAWPCVSRDPTPEGPLSE